MEIKLAQVYGFCGDDGKFGVSGAMQTAIQAAKDKPNEIYLIGALVHNEHVSNKLKKGYGIKIVSSLTEVPMGKTVVVKAQGEPPSFFEEAQKRNIKLINATCAMVTSAQNMVKTFANVGKKIVYIASSKDHDEAVSTCSQVNEDVEIVTIQELDNLDIKDPQNTVVMTQTTLSMLEIEESLNKLKKKYPQITLVPHLCAATTDRQKAVQELAKEVDLIIVVGAPHSSNSNRLREVAEKSGKPAYIVDNVDELNLAWFENINKVGITAGASTPQEILDEVINKIETIE